jgi:pimeloyl-ACP methyl ester carboxylesterase
MKHLRLLVVLLAGCGGEESRVAVAGAAAPTESDHEVVTSDGWTLVLHRYRPAQVAYSEPVLLTHGFIESRRVWDLDADHSLARVLVDAGFEVWTLDLRGSGASAGDGWAFDIDDFIQRDAPAAVDYVLATSGAPQLFFCGHSLGGLVVYGYCETEGASKVRGGVTLAGAGQMTGGWSLQLMLVNFFALLGLGLGPILPADLPFPPSAILEAALGENDAAWNAIGSMLDSPLGQPFWDAGNMTPALVTALLRDALSDTSMNVVKQFLAWAKGGAFPYREQLPQVEVPLLVVAGANDLVVPPANVQYCFNRVSSADKTYLELEGFGHEDLCVGARAPSELFPVIREWIRARATAR